MQKFLFKIIVIASLLSSVAFAECKLGITIQSERAAMLAQSSDYINGGSFQLKNVDEVTFLTQVWAPLAKHAQISFATFNQPNKQNLRIVLDITKHEQLIAQRAHLFFYALHQFVKKYPQAYENILLVMSDDAANEMMNQMKSADVPFTRIHRFVEGHPFCLLIALDKMK